MHFESPKPARKCADEIQLKKTMNTQSYERSNHPKFAQNTHKKSFNLYGA